MKRERTREFKTENKTTTRIQIIWMCVCVWNFTTKCEYVLHHVQSIDTLICINGIVHCALSRHYKQDKKLDSDRRRKFISFHLLININTTTAHNYIHVQKRARWNPEVHTMVSCMHIYVEKHETFNQLYINTVKWVLSLTMLRTCTQYMSNISQAESRNLYEQSKYSSTISQTNQSKMCCRCC